MKRKAGSTIRVSEKGYTYEEIFVSAELRGKFQRNEGIPAQAAKLAEEAVERLKADFLSWAKRDLEELRKLADLLAQNEEDEEAETLCKKIGMIAHDIRGQGSTFGFPLLTEISTCLGQAVKLYRLPRPETADLVRKLIGMLEQVLSQNLTERGGSVGEQMMRDAHRWLLLASDPERGGPAVST